MTAIRPTAWQTHRLGDLVKLVSGQSPSGFKFGSTGKPYFKVDQLGKAAKYLGRHSTPYLSDHLPEVPAGSVLIAKRGAAIALNRVCLLTTPGFMDTNVMALIPTTDLDSEFLYYWLSGRGLWDVADVTSVPQINNKHIKPLEIGLPDPDEQRAIVSALRSSDDAVSALEHLIAKKQAVKEGMTQQLLTGRTRLPGFNDAWRDLALGEAAQFRKGMGLPKSALAAGGRLPCVHYGELFTHYGPEIRSVTSRTNDASVGVRSAANDVLMPTSDVTPRGLAKASALMADGVALGGDILVIRSDRHQIFGPFLAHAIRLDANQVLQLVRGSTVYHLYATDMKAFRLRLPPVDEQRAICDVLRDAEDEIELLRGRLTKARAIKTGMMQQLLTGRTRLPVEAAS